MPHIISRFYLSVLFIWLTACQTQSTTNPTMPPALSMGSGAVSVTTSPTITLPVWYHIPQNIDPKTAPIVIIMHGTNRDADRYRDEWRPLADENGFLLIVPEFSRKDWPGARGYNLGDVQSEDGPNPQSMWAYSQIEPLFDIMRASVKGRQAGYAIYGHSAGSQFVHRFIFHNPDSRAEQVISANAGWYTLPDFDETWPYGLAGSFVTEASLEAALEAPVIILLGDQDNDPNHKSLRRTEEAMRQGPHRLARGHTFYDMAKAEAEARGLDFGWRLQIVEGARHSNAQMSKAAAPLFNSAPPMK